jgi:hypothetical protein
MKDKGITKSLSKLCIFVVTFSAVCLRICSLFLWCLQRCVVRDRFQLTTGGAAVLINCDFGRICRGSTTPHVKALSRKGTAFEPLRRLSQPVTFLHYCIWEVARFESGPEHRLFCLMLSPVSPGKCRNSTKVRLPHIHSTSQIITNHPSCDAI